MAYYVMCWSLHVKLFKDFMQWSAITSLVCGGSLSKFGTHVLVMNVCVSYFVFPEIVKFQCLAIFLRFTTVTWSHVYVLGMLNLSHDLSIYYNHSIFGMM